MSALPCESTVEDNRWLRVNLCKLKKVVISLVEHLELKVHMMTNDKEFKLTFLDQDRWFLCALV